ncbi:MAG: hypothetical protein MRJ96_06710 [Nitrospirales bacterium]|nr:hypothetical protein [Nitrospira sp.]MDR4501125.1 hypothetical protein [Nitrospirales bacterium]
MNAYFRHPVPLLSFSLLLVLVVFLHGRAYAETPAPEIHWGALAYPDQYPILQLGLTLNRFTEFNGEGERFNGIHETIGLNQITLSWTEHFTTLKNWSTNLTVGAGPTRDQPTRYLQNEVVHEGLKGIPKVPVGEKRRQTDFMITGSLNRWLSIASHERLGFAGLGVTSGSLYHEVFGRIGFRRWSIVETFYEKSDKEQPWWVSVFGPLKLSGIYRYSRIWEGAAFRALASESHIAQGSLSYGWFRPDGFPKFEVEFGVTIDSGIFLDVFGDSLEERFYSVAIRFHPITIETWNDQLNNKDFGPTYGARLMLELYTFLPKSWQWR